MNESRVYTHYKMVAYPAQYKRRSEHSTSQRVTHMHPCNYRSRYTKRNAKITDSLESCETRYSYYHTLKNECATKHTKVCFLTH